MPSPHHLINIIKQQIALKSNMNLIYNSGNNYYSNFALKIYTQMIRDDKFMKL